MFILGIETSCDETTASIVNIDENKGILTPLSNVISSQVKLHSEWGGVVPNLAAREHLKNILPVIEASLDEAGVSHKDIDLIAVTNGPGLIPALLIGTNAAKTISYVWKKPLLGIHHIEGHIYANFINKNYKDILFPVLCLVVSGGHTQLVLMKDHLDYTIVGETQDDAAGEAFDKVARILGLGYPGGPAISAKAENHKPQATNHKLNLPRPMINSKDFNFSFSGLKTAVLYSVKKDESLLKDPDFISAMSSEFQQAVIDVLIKKTMDAAKKYNPKSIILAGGVSANKELGRQMEEAVKNDLKDTCYQMPDIRYSLDNAAMIAAAAFFRYKVTDKKENLLTVWKNLQADANLKLSSKK